MNISIIEGNNKKMNKIEPPIFKKKKKLRKDWQNFSHKMSL